MPSLNFVLPHWLYWGALIVFPLVAMYLVRRQKRLGATTRISLFLAYLFLICSGFAGLHRFYLRNMWGFLYIPLLLGVVFGNVEIRDAREDVSRTRAAVETVHSQINRAKSDVQQQVAGAEDRLSKATAELAEREKAYAEQRGHLTFWNTFSATSAAIIAAFMLLDAFLLPGLARRRRLVEPARPISDLEPIPAIATIGTGEDPTLGLHTRFTDKIEAVNRFAGEFVAYWAILSVFGYFYEVTARFLFNSPTNWLHESMFLMYGMQYMAAGAYAYMTDQHVRVDVLYVKFSPRGKAVADIFTSIFFFIFAITMLITGARFAWDSMEVLEHSFTEWGVQYWPVKLMMPIGAFLIALQGLCRLIKDIVFVSRRGA